MKCKATSRRDRPQVETTGNETHEKEIFSRLTVFTHEVCFRHFSSQENSHKDNLHEDNLNQAYLYKNNL